MKRAITVLLALTMALSLCACGKGGAYKDAMSLYESGKYHEAAVKFTELGDYEKSKEMAKNSTYEEAKSLLDGGSYADARKIFVDLGSFEQSANYVNECDYKAALALYESGDLEGALAALEAVKTYNDAEAKIKEIKTELLHQQYGDVLDALEGGTWFFNGGEDTILNGISFAGDAATIAQVSYDGNGRHDNGGAEHPFTVDAQNIIVTMADGSELKIPYTLSGGAITLGDHDYYSYAEVDAQLQGYWSVRTSSTVLGRSIKGEKTIYIHDGTLESVYATESTDRYSYAGPHKGAYTLIFGGFETDMMHGSEWGFNIIDGKVAVLHFDHVGTPTDRIPSESEYREGRL